MKTSILLLLCFCFALHVEGQNITGRLLDEKRQPISFGNIKLEQPDSSFVTGTTSGENGRFQLSVSKKGNYVLIASYIVIKGSVPITRNKGDAMVTNIKKQRIS